MKTLILRAALLGTAATALAAAQPVIRDVVNAASRIPSGFPSYGIAQGALFAITGTGLASDPLQQAAFPLPTTDGLGGVTLQLQVGGATIDAILVYVSSTEVGAILPSNTPTGTGTVTLNSAGTTATAPITVVAAAFGAFSLDYYSGTQFAAAFNVAADGTTSLNYLSAPGAPAVPGQTVNLNGTGLGAIAGDETQPGAADASSAAIQVFVGNMPATVVSAGRGVFPALPDGMPAFPVPTGVSAWDVIQFIVPDGVTGCHVPVVVQIGNFVSNFIWISISSDGGPCVDPNTADFGDNVTLSGTATIGYVNLLRTTIRNSSNGLATEIGSEIGTANFVQYDVPSPVTVPVSQYAFSTLSNNFDPGTCLVQTFRAVIPASPGPVVIPPDRNPPREVDAGPLINLKNGAGVAKQLKKNKDGSYSAGLGSSFSVPGVPSGPSQLFLVPGAMTTDNGSGGADIGPFTSTLTLPTPVFSFDNIDALGPTIDRTQGLTVKWSGGNPASFVNITGSSINQTGNVTLIGSFTCSERVSAGQFTVPPFVTLTLPVSASDPPQKPLGTLALWTYTVERMTIPSVDLAIFSVVLETQKTVPYR
jgi:uncharacterized protein (TIGR03437 family)